MPRHCHAVPVAAFVLACGLIACGSVIAQDQTAPATVPGSDDARYSFHRIQDSFVRLDGRTGQVSVCGRETAGWACRAVPDERLALEEAIGRLQNDNAVLKKELLAKGLPLPSSVKPDAPVAGGGDKAKSTETAKTPSAAELDRALGFVEKVWRRLLEIMVEFQRDLQRKS